jgi:hypothetical protein
MESLTAANPLPGHVLHHCSATENVRYWLDCSEQLSMNCQRFIDTGVLELECPGVGELAEVWSQPQQGGIAATSADLMCIDRIQCFERNSSIVTNTCTSTSQICPYHLDQQ